MLKIGTYVKESDTTRIIKLAYGEKLECHLNQNPTSDKSPNLIVKINELEIGSLWKKISQKGNNYLSGNILLPCYKSVFINILFSDKGNEVFLVELESKQTDNSNIEL